MNNKEEKLERPILRFSDNEEKEFWKSVFIASLNSKFIDDTADIADYGLINFRRRNIKDKDANDLPNSSN